MLLRIVSQMALGTHSFQVFVRTIGGIVVKVGYSQGAPMCIERFTGLPALLATDFALPSCSVLYCTSYRIPIFWVKLTLHWHLPVPPYSPGKRHAIATSCYSGTLCTRTRGDSSSNRNRSADTFRWFLRCPSGYSQCRHFPMPLLS